MRMSTVGSLLRQLRGLHGVPHERNAGIASRRSLPSQRTTGMLRGHPSPCLSLPSRPLPAICAYQFILLAVPSADVGKTSQEGFHLTAANKACSETINTAEVYRAVEGHLGSLSSSPVVHSPRHVLPETQSVTQAMTMMCLIFCDATMCHTYFCPRVSVWCRLIDLNMSLESACRSPMWSLSS